MPDHRLFNRRNFLAASVVLIPAMAWAQQPPERALAPAQLPGLRFRSISVDTGPLAARGVRAAAELMGRAMPSALAKTFADRLNPADRNAPALRVSLDLALFDDGGGADNFSPPTDSLRGVGQIVGSRGEILAVYPLLTPLAGFRQDRLAPVNGYDLRAQLLAEQFSYWLRREIGI